MALFKYRIERMQLMVQCGLNVPDYVENVYTQYDQGSVAFLREKFGDSRVRYLSNAPGKDVVTEMVYNWADRAYDSCVAIEPHGHTTWIMDDDICCEYEGTVRVNKRGSGMIKYDGMFKGKFRFQDFEVIPEIRHKIIVRRVYKFLKENAWMSAIIMDFGWAKEFCGSQNEKIVFFDFMPLLDFS